MKKAITLVALAAVAVSSSENFADDSFHMMHTLEHVKPTGKFLEHPQIKNTATKILGLDDDEFLMRPPTHKEIASTINVKDDIEKIKKFALKHPELVEKLYDQLKKFKDQKVAKTNEKKTKEDPKKTHQDILHETIQLIKQIHSQHKKPEPAVQQVALDDEELFSFKGAWDNVKQKVGQGVDFVKHHPALIGDGVHIAKDIGTRNVPGLIKDGIKTAHHAGAFDDEELFAFDDEELWTLKGTYDYAKQKVGQGYDYTKQKVGQGVNYVKQHPQIVGDGVRIAKDLKNRNVPGLVKDGIKTARDFGVKFDDEELFAFEDEELFDLKNVINHVKDDAKKGIDYVKNHPQVVTDGVKIVKDVKTHQYKNLVQDSVKTAKDIGIKFDDDLELYENKFIDLGWEKQY